ncbi:hypothetical protein C1645_736589 [Glomus cerebriforme]|uniref:Uncharacterized protein n=1 Tax=Glomus cerebriforme TaxID=658196 RepID=A0A397T1D3_9GLOM|nr:hypothetical protein C1645_736589 [Glomus cerebriforme]
MDCVTCQFIKRDGSICEGVCTCTTGCARHWKLYEKNMKKRHCLIYGFPTDADSGYCAKYCSKYSAKFHALNYRMRQKYKAEACQSRIPEAPIFELGNGDRSFQPRIPDALIFKLSDVVRPLQSRIYKTLVSESDDEDFGLDLFGN